MTDEEFGVKFLEFLEGSVGVPFQLVASLEKDDDWTFIIKVFAIVEAGLNHLLSMEIENKKAAEVVSRLEVANDRKGKIALIKAYNLLSNELVLFVKLLAKVRSRAVHDVSGFGLNLREHILQDTQNKEGWKTALTAWCGEPPIAPSIYDTAFLFPRKAIHNCCMAIIIKCLKAETQQAQLRAHIEEASARYQPTPKE